MVAGGALGRAVLEAYKEAAAGRGAAAAAARHVAARRRMTPEEAEKVLETGPKPSEAKVQERFDLLHTLNAPMEESPGSPYLQARILAARRVLIDELVAKAKKDAGKDAGSKPEE